MKGNQTMSEFLGSFSDRADLTRIKILGHTGRSIFTALDTFVRLREKAGSSTVNLYLLLRDEGVETPKRREQIANARRTIKNLHNDYRWLHVETRFYSAIQTLRGAIVEFSGGEKAIYCSAYQWTLPTHGEYLSVHTHPIKTSAVKWAAVIPPDAGNDREDEFGGLLENWFDYYWGPGLIHTIAFDFDDTLIDTYNDKIDAWAVAIEKTRKEFGDQNFLPKFIGSYPEQNGQQLEHLKPIVDKYPGKTEIIRQILKKSTPAHILNFMNKARSSLREKRLFPRMDEVALRAHIQKKLFPSVRSALNALASQGYSLAIASLTDEERIEKALELAEIGCMYTIVGSAEYKNRELPDYLAEKVYLLRKIANLGGIPVSRVLYVGDHHRDEHAASEVGASFIHARLLSEVEPSSNSETLDFEDFGKLARAVADAESVVRAREIAPQKKIHYA